MSDWVAEAERRLPKLRDEIPKGWLARWGWARARRKFEYELFNQGGLYGSWAWMVVKEENNLLGVWDHLAVPSPPVTTDC